MSSTLKNLISVFGLIVLAAFAYYLFVLNTNSTLLTGDSLQDTSDIETRQFLVRLNELQNININTDVLSDSRLESLVDASVPGETYPVFRENPFAETN